MAENAGRTYTVVSGYGYAADNEQLDNVRHIGPGDQTYSGQVVRPDPGLTLVLSYPCDGRVETVCLYSGVDVNGPLCRPGSGPDAVAPRATASGELLQIL